jgi:hypothetical protein
MLSGKKGTKLGVIGEAFFRYLEWTKSRKYIRDELANLAFDAGSVILVVSTFLAYQLFSSIF